MVFICIYIQMKIYKKCSIIFNSSNSIQIEAVSCLCANMSSHIFALNTNLVLFQT